MFSFLDVIMGARRSLLRGPVRCSEFMEPKAVPVAVLLAVHMAFPLAMALSGFGSPKEPALWPSPQP